MKLYPKREDVLEEYRSKYWVIDMDRFSWTRKHAPSGKKIIDIGCCYGFMFQEHDRSTITSVDLDDYSHIVPNFVRANAQNLPFPDNSFDVAIITEILEHQDNWEDSKKVLSEACRVGGEVLITVPNEYLWKDTAADRFKDWEDVLSEQNNDMTNLSVRSAPFAKDRYKNKGNYEHIFHHHHFSAEDIEKMIKEVTDREHQVYILPNDGNIEMGAIGTTAVIIYD